MLYLGVLYHMKEPLTCLERVRAVTREVAVIETVAMQLPGAAGHSLLGFHAGGDLNLDFGNWYVPNIEALSTWCSRPASHGSRSCRDPRRNLRNRSGRLCASDSAATRGATYEEYRAIVHAFV